MPTTAIAIFDIGKTNKKFFLFDIEYNVLHQEYTEFEELDDEDGDPCDDLEEISNWMKETLKKHLLSNEYNIKQLNFSTYGASFVHINNEGFPVTLLYNYLKPFPEEVERELQRVMDVDQNNLETASPYLGMLNSGLQLFWLKQKKTEAFQQIKTSLHLPQYFSFLFTENATSELTSIGCHTRLWNFQKKQYHHWLSDVDIDHLLPDPLPLSTTFPIQIEGKSLEVGIGIHDSSAALVPYLIKSQEPFILISTGTWSITLNPFTKDPLTKEELDQDCLEYLSALGKPVKASRLFLGNDLQQKVKSINELFDVDSEYFKSIKVNHQFINNLKTGEIELKSTNQWSPGKYSDYDEAYHYLCLDMAVKQKNSVYLAKGSSSVNKIFLDGGFVDNEVFVAILKVLMPEFEIVISSVPNGSAVGAAMVINEKSLVI